MEPAFAGRQLALMIMLLGMRFVNGHFIIRSVYHSNLRLSAKLD